MAAQTQDRKIKCRHCGWIRTVPASVIADESMADVVLAIEPSRASSLRELCDEKLWADLRQAVLGATGARYAIALSRHGPLP